MRKNVNNILRTYRAATKAEVIEGMGWYALANREIQRRLLDVDLTTGCGVVAALSPQTAWARNIKMADILIRTGHCYSCGARVRKAQAILRGSDPRVLLNATAKGRLGKERSFFECLLDPTTDAWVCVDGHAWSIWYGQRVETSKVPSFPYRDVAHDYFRAADRVGIAPNQLQAITWLVHRDRNRVRKEVDREFIGD